MAHDVFISHSSVNKKAADAICHALENHGIKCWIAPRDVTPGAEYAEEIMNGIEYCTVFLLVLSKEANESKPVSKEIENALRYEKKVVPFFLESVTIRKALEYYLTNLHWLNADPDDTGFDGLAEEIRRVLGVSAPPVPVSAPEPVPEPAPAPEPAPPEPESAPVPEPAPPEPEPAPAPPKALCKNCQASYDPKDDAFCPECGARLDSPDIPATLFCINCGTEYNPAEDMFCLSCGEKL